MSDANKGRYHFGKKLHTTLNGDLYVGKDLSLNRDVLLYRLSDETIESTDSQALLSNASGLTDPRFLHILDIGFDERGVYVVLEHRQGELLNDHLRRQPYPFSQALSLIYQLGSGIRTASEERVRGFSLSADNIWLSSENELIIVNYWSQGHPSQTGTKGLIHLLYELVASSMVVVGEIEHLEQLFRKAMNGIPEQTVDSFLRILKQTYIDHYSLSSFLQDIHLLLKERLKSSEPSQKKEAAISTRPIPTPKDHEPVKSKKSLPNRYLVFALIGVILFVGMFLFVRHILITPQTAPPTPGPITENKGADQKKVEPSPAPTTPLTPTTNTEEIIVPNLQGLKREDAEKQALASGLHYQFFLEATDQPAGIVTKQDLPVGKKVAKTTTITFWVSKGKG